MHATVKPQRSREITSFSFHKTIEFLRTPMSLNNTIHLKKMYFEIIWNLGIWRT